MDEKRLEVVQKACKWSALGFVLLAVVPTLAGVLVDFGVGGWWIRALESVLSERGLDRVAVWAIGAVTVLVLIEQARTGKRQVRLGEEQLWLGVYDKRYAVYQGVREYLSAVLGRNGATLNMLSKLLVDTRESEWLLGGEVEKYVKEELHEKGSRLWAVGEVLEKREGTTEERRRRVEEQSDLVKWHIQQVDRVRGMFEKYLSVRKGLREWSGEV